VERDGLWRAQTPQGFSYADILAAHRAAADATDLTDDAAVAERAGLAVRLVEGDAANLKVTTPADLERAARWLAGGGEEIRTGMGFDVHRFEPGDRVRLCGVDVPHDRALAGHSDADVGLHALVDAILGALAAGDIGSHFPPSDPQWRGADSALFAAHARDLVAARGGRIVNVDVTIICESPKIGPHRQAMMARLAELLGIDVERVSVKATTTERLGFTGRGEGIAAQASATIALPRSSEPAADA
jgi:2-C-methyl-D-erythritol 4-phosphate cytidylyltransferase/2-C-methyl-D-erythritol 2,4-cyclodiphosphate synthase